MTIRDSSGQQQKLLEWLANFNLQGNPFALSEADQEQTLLAKIFVERPYLNRIFGDPAHPQAAILRAGRGAGKSAAREMVAYECLHGRAQPRALPVRYTQFDHLLGQVDNVPEKLTVRHHVSSILRLILAEIKRQAPLPLFGELPESERSLLKSYSTRFADSLTDFWFGQALNVTGFPLDWEAMTPYEILSGFAEIVPRISFAGQERGAGQGVHYGAIYLLIDRVDETEVGAEAALPILAPLMSQGALINLPGLAFKFFLSSAVTEKLLRLPAVRPERFAMEEINWNEEGLRDVVDQRLLYFSNGYILHFEELCSPRIRNLVTHRLIEAAAYSPRSLIRLCSALLEKHMELRTEGHFIDRADLAAALQDFKSAREEEPDYPARPGLGEPQAHPERGLEIDASGHVWIDKQQVTDDFSEQEYRLLKMLYTQSPKVVPAEELIKAIWYEEYLAEAGSGGGFDSQNLRKLVARLRDRLGDGDNPRVSRFIKTAHGRGYWLEKQ